MKKRKLGWHFLAVVAALLIARGVLDAQTPAKAPVADANVVVKVEKISIKAFHLTQREPYEVGYAVRGLLGEMPGGVGFGMLGGGFLGGVGMGGIPGGGFGGGAVGGQGILGGGPLGNPFDVATGPSHPAWRAAVEPRTSVLVVRGTDKELQTATDLIAALEAPADQPAAVKTIALFPLKHASADVMATALSFDEQVRLTGPATELVVLQPALRFAALPSAQLLIAAGPQESLKNLHEVVQKLDAPAAAAKGKKLETAVFRLKTAAPDEVRDALAMLLDREGNAAAVAQPGVGGVPAPIGEDPSNMRVRLVVDARTRSLIVRGIGRDMQVARDFVATVETPAAKPLPKTKLLEAFRVKHADPEELAEVIRQLELEVRIVTLPTGKLLIADGVPEELRQLRIVVEQLDVAASKEGGAPKDVERP